MQYTQKTNDLNIKFGLNISFFHYLILTLLNMSYGVKRG
jgi:hypothetical protein